MVKQAVKCVLITKNGLNLAVFTLKSTVHLMHNALLIRQILLTESGVTEVLSETGHNAIVA